MAESGDIIPESIRRQLLKECSVGVSTIMRSESDLSLNDLIGALCGGISSLGDYDNLCIKHSILLGVLDALNACLPKGNDMLHKTTLMQCLGGAKNILSENYDATALLPAPSDKYMMRYANDFFALQLSRWADYIVHDRAKDGEEKEGNRVLDKTKYLFITWDLRDLDRWEEYLTDKIGVMLKPIAKKSLITDKGVSPILIHRLIFLRWNQFKRSKDLQNRFFNEIWFPYFQPWTAVPNNYFISFLDLDVLDIEDIFDDKDIKEELKELYDLAFFSFDDKIKKAAIDIVLPNKAKVRDAINEYSVLQYSKRPNCEVMNKKSYFMLYLLAALDQSDDSHNEIRKRYDQTIAVLRTLMPFWDLIDKSDEIKRVSRVWVGDGDDEKHQHICEYLSETIDESCLDKKYRQIVENGIEFNKLNMFLGQ